MKQLKKDFSHFINTALRAANNLGPNNINSEVFKAFVAKSRQMALGLYPLDAQTMKDLDGFTKFASELSKTAHDRASRSRGHSLFF